MTGHFEVVRLAAFEAKRDGDVVGVDLVGRLDQRFQQWREFDGAGLLPLQFGVEPAGVGNIRNQAVEPPDVVLDHFQQALAALLGLGERQRLHRRAQRGERVAQFVRHVGGEALDRLDAGIERVGHFAQRAGQMADLVACGG